MIIGPNIQLLVTALESGQYTQGRKRLRSSDGSFCCLGVACDLFSQIKHRGYWEIDPHIRPDNWTFHFPISGIFGIVKSYEFTQMPPLAVKQWLAEETGYKIINAPLLARMNDSREMSFAEIAQFLRTTDGSQYLEPIILSRHPRILMPHLALPPHLQLLAYEFGAYRKKELRFNMCDEYGNFCAIGLACDVYRRQTNRGKWDFMFNGMGYFTIETPTIGSFNKSYMSRFTDVIQWYSIGCPDGYIFSFTTLLDWNDRQEWSFARIAHMIQTDPFSVLVRTVQ